MNTAATATTLPAPPDDWHELPFVGYQDDGDGGWLELRNAPSKTTIRRQVMCGVGCGCKASWIADGVWLCDGCSRAWGLR